MSRILLIEDDPDSGASLQMMALLAGYDTHWVRNGKEAIATFCGDTKWDLVVTDILMPEMDGLESIQFIRGVSPNLPVVAITGQRDTPFLRAAKHFGASITLLKPFTAQEFEKAIVQALGREKE